MGSLLALWIATRNPKRRRIIREAWFIIAAAMIGEVAGIFTGTRHYLHETMMSAIFTGILALSLKSKVLIQGR